MPSDFRTAVKKAAPHASSPLEVSALRSRARRVAVVRALGAVAAMVVVITGVFLAPQLLSHGSVRPARGGAPPGIPGGPRYEVVSGTFGEDWDDHAGKRWRVLVWGQDDTFCHQLWIEGFTDKNQSLGCTTPSNGEEIQEDLLGGMSIYTGSSNPEEFQFTVGVTSPRVDRLEFREESQPARPIELYDAPPQTRLPYRYYAITLPYYDYADLVALGEDGETLEAHHLCGPGCQADREAEQLAKIEAYERTPVTMDAKAAVFALTAVAQAGLMDRFTTSTYYDYMELTSVDERYDARFDVFRCTNINDKGASYSCRPLDNAVVSFRHENDRFVVTHVSGPMSEDQRGVLVGYREEIPAGKLGWRLVATSVAGHSTDKHRPVRFVLVWAGNIPAPVSDYRSLCTMRVYDARDEVIFSSRPLPFPVPSGEQERDAQVDTGLERDASKVESVDVTCGRLTHDLHDQLLEELD